MDRTLSTRLLRLATWLRSADFAGSGFDQDDRERHFAGCDDLEEAADMCAAGRWDEGFDLVDLCRIHRNWLLEAEDSLEAIRDAIADQSMAQEAMDAGREFDVSDVRGVA